MRLNFKKAIALTICLCFMFTFNFNKAFASTNSNIDKSSVKIVTDNDKECTVMAEYKGDKLYATLDKETNEITMESVEKPKSKILGFAIGKETKKNYKVKVEDAYEGKISAKVIDVEGGKEFKISDNLDKVTAQIPVAIPLIEILGSALISALLILATSIVIGGATYYVASKVAEKLREKNYDYYLAAIKNGKVYIGPSVNYSTAYATVDAGSDIFSRTESLAKGLAKAVGGGFARGPEIHGSQPNYFYHYHPKYGSSASYYAHCFF